MTFLNLQFFQIYKHLVCNYEFLIFEDVYRFCSLMCRNSDKTKIELSQIMREKNTMHEQIKQEASRTLEWCRFQNIFQARNAPHGSIAANMLAAFLVPKMLIRKFLSAFSVPKILIRVFEAAFSKPKIPTSIFGVKNAGQNFCFRKFWLKNALTKILISIFEAENADENFRLSIFRAKNAASIFAAVLPRSMTLSQIVWNFFCKEKFLIFESSVQKLKPV